MDAIVKSPFSTMKPGTTVAYWVTADGGVHFGRFRKYEQEYSLVTVETVAAYKAQPQTLVMHEDLVQRDTGKPTPKAEIKRRIAESQARREAEAEAALQLAAKKRTEKKTARSRAFPVEIVAAQKPAAKPADWRKLAAAKAWETMRAKKAASLAVA